MNKIDNAVGSLKQRFGDFAAGAILGGGGTFVVMVIIFELF